MPCMLLPRLELTSYKRILNEAEAAKTEGLKLRQQMAEMRDIQTLMSGNFCFIH